MYGNNYENKITICNYSCLFVYWRLEVNSNVFFLHFSVSCSKKKGEQHRRENKKENKEKKGKKKNKKRRKRKSNINVAHEFMVPDE